MVCSNPKLGTGHNFLLSGKTMEKTVSYISPWYFVKNRTLNFNTSSERPHSKLSENHNINVIGQTEQKLCPFKDALFNATYMYACWTRCILRMLAYIYMYM